LTAAAASRCSGAARKNCPTWKRAATHSLSWRECLWLLDTAPTQIPTLPSDFSTLTTAAFPPIERQGTRRRGDRQRRHQAAASRRT
jgi:hypothetical protein